MRLTERYGDDWDAAAAAIRVAAAPSSRRHALLGVDGTTAELAALGDGRGARSPSVDEAARLAALLDRRGAPRAPACEPDRSDVIAAGVLVLRETLRHLGRRPRRGRPSATC